MNRIYLISCLWFLIPNFSSSQEKVDPPKPIYPIPSPSQMAWHEMEMNAFIHFGINTFTDQEWGMGNENPMLFNPGNVNTRQWVSVLKEAGFKGIILTCKHHDGFCLWPSQYTDYSIKSSPFKDGGGNIAKDLSQACKEQNIKFGVYLSPWDRNRADYGTLLYPDYYRNQLKELFLSSGPVFEMWFDGANGGTGYYGGANEKRTISSAIYYDWPKTIELIKDIDPNVIFFSDAGPGARWCGNEEGRVNSTNWNMINPDTLYAGKPGTEA
ncbi:MAG TPA: alpha-L-fucosidase, partial [Bacteroidales bacterium]|nr:alpha-L-fucosidase [Bacteroidales bacterium]